MDDLIWSGFLSGQASSLVRLPLCKSQM